jgi:trimethylamine:corrinoid methyltransferase-like protein
VQLLLDRDYAVGAQQLGGEVDVSPDNLGLETILEVGVGLERNFFESAHTLEHFRSSLWLPRLLDRSGWDGFGEEQKVLDKANAQVHELLAAYEKPEGREGQLAEMRQVLERARRELVR